MWKYVSKGKSDMTNKRMNELNIKGKIALVAILLILSCLVGYMLLVMAYSIPTDYMKGNMSESAGIIKTEGRYFRTMNRENSQLDNYTDSLMLLTASHPTTENAWKGQLMYRDTIGVIKNRMRY